MKIELIVTDLDETVIGDHGEISKRTIDAFQRCRERGIQTAIATARTARSAQRQAQVLGAEWIICSNGSRVLHVAKPIYEESLGYDLTKQLISELKGLLSLQDMAVETRTEIYHNRENLPPGHAYQSACLFDFRQELDEDAVQIFAGIASPEDARKVAGHIPECSQIHYGESTRYAFVRKGVSKQKAIKILADSLGISLEHTAAFGDDRGDMEMLKACGCGVAMGNALPEVKQVAGFVTGTNVEDGVAEFIEREILSDIGD